MVKKMEKTEKNIPLAQEGEKTRRTKIRVIGIGGGAGNIISELASKVRKATFVAANTDSKDLRSVSRKVEKFQFGQSLTQGLGTGMNPDLGATAAQNDKERIKKLLQGQDLVILIACLGGGTGSGAAPIFARISRSLGNLTFGIFTLPFNFEGERKIEVAKDSLEETRSKLNVLSVIPNERIFQIIKKDVPLKEALSAINRNLAESLEGLIEIIYEPGLINIDFADLRTILQGRGRFAYLNTASMPRKEGAAKDLIEKVLNNPLYPYGIKGAKTILFNIAGEKNLGLNEVNQISKTISELLNKEAKIIFGVSQGKKYAGVIKTTLLVSGCGLKLFPKNTKRKKTIKTKSQVKKPAPEIKEKKKIPPERKSAKKRRPKKRKAKAAPKSKKTQKPKKKKKIQLKLRIKKEKKPAQEEKNQTQKEGTSLPVLQVKVRKNALQIKKEAEELEKEMLEEEKLWETPAFLRKKGPFTV